MSSRSSMPGAVALDAASTSSGYFVRRQPFVIGPAALGEPPRLVGQVGGRWLGRAETGARLDRLVPVRRPRAVGRAAARGPVEHGAIEGDAEPAAQSGQRARGVG